MKYMKSKLINLPRPFRIWWGKCFIYMLGKIGTDEFPNDITLYNELKLWLDEKGKPNKK
jgi:hypothetical protein